MKQPMLWLAFLCDDSTNMLVRRPRMSFLISSSLCYLSPSPLASSDPADQLQNVGKPETGVGGRIDFRGHPWRGSEYHRVDYLRPGARAPHPVCGRYAAECIFAVVSASLLCYNMPWIPFEYYPATLRGYREDQYGPRARVTHTHTHIDQL